MIGTQGTQEGTTHSRSCKALGYRLAGYSIKRMSKSTSLSGTSGIMNEPIPNSVEEKRCLQDVSSVDKGNGKSSKRAQKALREQTIMDPER